MAEQQNSSSTSTLATPATNNPNGDIESQQRTQEKSSHWQLVIDQIHVTPEVINWPYNGSGTEEDPYVVVYIENDRRNPQLFPMWKKWMITVLVAFVSSTFPLTPSPQKEQKKHGWPFCQTSFINTIKALLMFNIAKGHIGCVICSISLQR